MASSSIMCLVGRGSGSAILSHLNLSSRSISGLSCGNGIYRYCSTFPFISSSTTFNKTHNTPTGTGTGNGTGSGFFGVNNIQLRNITTTSVLLAEPLKKKKKMDPAIIKAREARKQRKLEKSIRRLERNARQLKPLDELQVPTSIQDNPKQRYRAQPQLSSEQVEQRWVLEKEVRKLKFEQHSAEIRVMEKLLKSQNKALAELSKASQELYEAAIDFDPSYLPYKAKGPVETPPISNYPCPEGDYFDISRKWE